MKLYTSITVKYKPTDGQAMPLRWFLDRIDMKQLEISGKVVSKEEK